MGMIQSCPKFISLMVFVIACLGMTGVASAQGLEDRPVPGYNMQYWRPAPMPGDYLSTFGTLTEEAWRVTGGFYLNYALNSMEIAQSSTASDLAIVKNQVYLDLFASVALWDFLEFSLVMPVALYLDTEGSANDAYPSSIGSRAHNGAAGAGDLRILLKGKILDVREYPVGLALIADLSTPTGNEKKLMGDKGATFALLASLELNPWGKARMAFNLGYRYRAKQNIYNYTMGQALLLSGAISIPFFLDNLDFLADMRGDITVGGDSYLDSAERPFEADFAFRYRFINNPDLWAHNLSMTLGIGTGTNAVGVPDVRVMLGLSFHWVNGGALNIDAEYGGYITPPEPCPDPEMTPLSQIPDRCRNKLIDTDGDTIPDNDDACPFKGRVGFIDEHGCPPDTDGDGYVDYEDLCPNEGIEVMGRVDRNGCPIKDTDKDGFYDDVDKCPNNPETFNGFEDEDGCPDADPDALVELADGKINIKEQVFFETSKAIIKPESFELLDQVAKLLIDNPHVGNIMIEGHTDSRGKYKSNMKLSQDRADSVRKYLIKAGVDASRLTAKGYGPDRPIDTNDTAEGRANNRRVEFVVLGLPEDADTGNTHVTE